MHLSDITITINVDTLKDIYSIHENKLSFYLEMNTGDTGFRALCFVILNKATGKLGIKTPPWLEISIYKEEILKSIIKKAKEKNITFDKKTGAFV